MSSFIRVLLTTSQSYTYWVKWGIAVVCSDLSQIHTYKKNLNKMTFVSNTKKCFRPAKWPAEWGHYSHSRGGTWTSIMFEPHLPSEIYLPKCLLIGSICLPKATKVIIPVSVLYYDFNFLSSFTFQLTCSWYPKELIRMKWRCGQNGLAYEF